MNPVSAELFVNQNEMFAAISYRLGTANDFTIGTTFSAINDETIDIRSIGA